MTSTSLTPYVQTLKVEITEDLARIVSPEQLQDEVEKTLAKAVAANAVNKIQAFINDLSWGSKEARLRSEAEVNRALRSLVGLLDHRASNQVLIQAEVAE